MKIGGIFSNKVAQKQFYVPNNNHFGQFKSSKNSGLDSVSFSGLIPAPAVKSIKMCVFDLDETLLEGAQPIRNKIMAFAQEKGRVLVYSSNRTLGKIQPLIDNGTLVAPDYVVGGDGVEIFKNVGGKFEEIKTWSDKLKAEFDKSKVRQIMLKIAKENMFPPEEWAKVPAEIIPAGQAEFRGSKITEYIGHESPLNIRFAIAPGVHDKVKPQITQELEKAGIPVTLIFHKYAPGLAEYETLKKWFNHEIALDLSNHFKPRLYPDGSHDSFVISAKADKGSASEFLRKSLGLKPENVFAAGNDVNDASNASHGYFFTLVANSSEHLKKMVENFKNIVRPEKAGVDGIWQAIEP